MRLGRDDQRVAFEFLRKLQNAAGRADIVGVVDDGRRAFGVGGDGRLRVLLFQLEQFGFRKSLVDDAHTGPQQHLAVELARQVAAEVPVGPEDDLLFGRDLGKDRLGAGGGDDHVGQRLHLGRTIDVGQRDVIGVGFAEGAELFGRAAVFKAAPRVHVGQDHDLVGREDLGGIGHELDAAKGDHVGVGRRRLAAEFEAVAHEVGNVLDVRRLVIMRKDHRVAFFAQAVDLGQQIGAGGDFGDDAHGSSRKLLCAPDIGAAARFSSEKRRTYMLKPGGRKASIGRSAPGVPAITQSVSA